MAKKNLPEFNFENALNELAQIVKTMENNELSLEDSLKQFEQGIILTRECQQALKTAEQKIQILINHNGNEQLSDYEDKEE